MHDGMFKRASHELTSDNSIEILRGLDVRLFYQRLWIVLLEHSQRLHVGIKEVEFADHT